VGMSAARLAAIDRVVQRGIDAGGFPGASVVVGRKGAAVWEKGFGRTSWSSADTRVTADRTIYDLASLTKVVGTATAVMVLYDEGKLDLNAPVSKYLPAFTGGAKSEVTVWHLLTHRSGLPAGRDLWRRAHNPQEARLMVIDTPLECNPGRCYIYSDLGADLLGMVVEAASGEGLDTFLAKRVFRPLGMEDTGFRPADSLRYRIAPTEVSPPRGYPIRGEVHDENAYALGGVAGHAGLFSTAADLSIFAQMMLNGGEYDGVRILQPATVEMFTRRAAGTRALGWDTADGDYGAGRFLTERAYGHTGFTGTSMWIDPDREMFVVLLTNRVHAARARRPAKVISDVRSDLSDAASLAVMDAPTGPMAMPSKFRADKKVGWNKPVRTRSARGSKSSKARSATSAKSKARNAKSSTSKKPSAKVSKAAPSKSAALKAKNTKASTSKASTTKASTTKSRATKPATTKKKVASRK
jgi:serine-type D-Ala-D-Ala carboxypeptidase